MAETVDVEMPRQGLREDLADALAARGLVAELDDRDEAVALHVRFADDERERLLAETAHALEAYLAERMLPLVVERVDGACVVRPPAD